VTCGSGVQTRTCTHPTSTGTALACVGASTLACTLAACVSKTITITQAYVVPYTTYSANVAGYNAALVNYEATYMNPPVSPASLTVSSVTSYTASNCANCILVKFSYVAASGDIQTVGEISAAIANGNATSAAESSTTGVSMSIATSYQAAVSEAPAPSSAPASNTGLYAGIGGGVAGVIILGIVAFCCYRRRADADASNKAVAVIAADSGVPMTVPMTRPKPVPPPPSVSPRAGSPWSRVLDPSTNQYYYYNAGTNESLWTKPADF